MSLLNQQAPKSDNTSLEHSSTSEDSPVNKKSRKSYAYHERPIRPPDNDDSDTIQDLSGKLNEFGTVPPEYERGQCFIILKLHSQYISGFRLQGFSIS